MGIQGDASKALSHAQKSVFVEPSRSAARRSLAVLSLQNENPEAALAALSSVSAGIDGDSAEGLGLQAVARALRLKTNQEEQHEDALEAKKLAQKGVMLAPWEIKNWESLAYVRTRTEGVIVL